MDLDEWEFIPHDGFLEIHDDGGKKIFSRKFGNDPNTVFDMNYFIPTSPKSPKFADTSKKPRPPKQLVPVPIQFHPTIDQNPNLEIVKEITKLPIEISIKPPIIEADQDSVSQVFFKKENEFVDMKMESPKSASRGILAQRLEFEDKTEDMVEKEIVNKEDEVNWGESNGGLNIWKWSLSGIGAICSFGAAAATICIIIFASGQKNKKNHQKLQFQIYADDKRIKQVVHQATRLNEAISTIRGVPLSRANITFGGYYDGL